MREKISSVESNLFARVAPTVLPMLPQVQIELGIGRTRTGMFLATFYLNEEELNGESGGGWVGTG